VYRTVPFLQDYAQNPLAEMTKKQYSYQCMVEWQSSDCRSAFCPNQSMYRNIYLTDPPERAPSPPKSATQAAIEETFSFDGPPDAMISVAGKAYLYFGGNGYFGLQADPEVLAAACEAV
jgi:hypothetical protein